jgi:hypothetical protein
MRANAVSVLSVFQIHIIREVLIREIVIFLFLLGGRSQWGILMISYWRNRMVYPVLEIHVQRLLVSRTRIREKVLVRLENNSYRTNMGGVDTWVKSTVT